MSQNTPFYKASKPSDQFQNDLWEQLRETKQTKKSSLSTWARLLRFSLAIMVIVIFWVGVGMFRSEEKQSVTSLQPITIAYAVEQNTQSLQQLILNKQPVELIVKSTRTYSTPQGIDKVTKEQDLTKVYLDSSQATSTVFYQPLNENGEKIQLSDVGFFSCTSDESGKTLSLSYLNSATHTVETANFSQGVVDATAVCANTTYETVVADFSLKKYMEYAGILGDSPSNAVVELDENYSTELSKLTIKESIPNEDGATVENTVSQYFFDKKSFLLVKTTSQTEVAGKVTFEMEQELSHTVLTEPITVSDQILEITGKEVAQLTMYLDASGVVKSEYLANGLYLKTIAGEHVALDYFPLIFTHSQDKQITLELKNELLSASNHELFYKLVEIEYEDHVKTESGKHPLVMPKSERVVSFGSFARSEDVLELIVSLPGETTYRRYFSLMIETSPGEYGMVYQFSVENTGE